MSKEFDTNIKFLLSNVSKVFILKIIGTALIFVLQVILGRKLGVYYFGQYTIFNVIINVFMMITVFGFDSSLIRYIPRVSKFDKLRIKLLKVSVLIVTSLSLVTGILIIIFKPQVMELFKIKNDSYYYIIPILLLVMSISKILDGFFQGEKKTDVVTFFNPLLNTLFKLIFFFIIILFTSCGNLYAAIISIILSETILLIIRVIYAFIEQNGIIKNENSEFDRSKYKELFKYSVSLFAIIGIGTLVTSVDKIIINAYVGSSQVGLYKVAENYMALVGIFASPFIVFWPLMSELYKKNELKDLEKMFNIIVKIISILAIPVVVFMLLFSKDLMSLFGHDFTSGAMILCVLLIGTTTDALAGPVGALLNMTDFAKLNLIDNIILAFVDILLNLILVPKIGAIGAAIATAISISLINIVNIIQNKIFLNVFPYDKDNIILIILGIGLFFVDKYLYIYININIFAKMITFGLINYIIFILAYYFIAKPNYKTYIKAFNLKKQDK